MSDPQRLNAVERALAAIIERFVQYPDALPGDGNLQATLFCALRHDPACAEVIVTRDGRHTGLVHWVSPGSAAEAGHADVVVLAPSFVRAHTLEAVLGWLHGPHSGGRLGSPDDDALALLAAAVLRWLPTLTPETLGSLQTSLEALVGLSPKASRLYLAVCCSHWDVEQHLVAAMPLFEHWAARYGQVSIVVAQAHYDHVGRVAAGRYLNQWTHAAPLPPLPAARRAGGGPWARPLG